MPVRSKTGGGELGRSFAEGEMDGASGRVRTTLSREAEMRQNPLLAIAFQLWHPIANLPLCTNHVAP